MVTITANKNAKQRTKNRIKEHGPRFEVLRELKSVQCLAGRAGVHLHSESKTSSDKKGGWDEWMGWLPLDEITVEEV